jgi:hypothetical protein
VLRIDAIPTKKLDTIKEWLTSVKIKYYESKMNLAWKPILKHILEDPKAFIDEVRATLHWVVAGCCGCAFVFGRHMRCVLPARRVTCFNLSLG